MLIEKEGPDLTDEVNKSKPPVHPNQNGSALSIEDAGPNPSNEYKHLNEMTGAQLAENTALQLMQYSASFIADRIGS
jgi:hypothetical protein